MSNRYVQQIAISEIGLSGQSKINNSKILVVGAGGLGIPVASYLAASGVGILGIMDGDKVEESNLHRQFMYSANETGESKSKLLSEKLSKQNPEVKIKSFEVFLDDRNASEIITNFDIVCDCTDNLETRILLDKTCHSLSKPLIYSAVKDWEGYVTVLHYKNQISLSDIFSFESLKENEGINCSVNGIVNTTCGIAGSLQATEAIKIVLGLNPVLDGTILCFNTLEQIYKKYNLQIKKNNK